MDHPLTNLPVILPVSDSTLRAIVARYHGDRVTVIVESRGSYGVYVDHGEALALVQAYDRTDCDEDAWEDATTLAERIA